MTDSRNQILSAEYLPDIRDILLTLWRYRLLILAVGGTTTLLGFIAVMAMPIYYKASATVIIQDPKVKLTSDFTDVTEGSKSADQNVLTDVQTEVKVLSSPNVALETIREAGLNAVPEFADNETDQRELLSTFAKNLTVAAQGTSRVIEISFKAKDPELAAKIVNTHVRAYLESQIDTKRARVEEMRKWFEAKVEDLKSDVIRKSQAVGQYRARENLAVGKDSQELIYQQISDTSAQLVPVQVRKYDLESKLKAIEVAQESGNQQAIIDVVKSPVIQQLKAQESTAGQLTLALQSKYGPKHPSLIAARSQLGQVRGAINTEIKNVIESLKNDLAAASAQEDLLTDQLNALKTQADTMRTKLITLKGLTVEQEASQKLLDNFLANYENIQSQVTFARSDAVIGSPAIAPLQPAKPGKKTMMLIVLVFAGSLSLGVVFVIEMLRGGLRNFTAIRRLGQTPLGIVPLTNNPIAVIRSALNSTLKEAIKRIYMSGLLNSKAHTLLITSAMPREGRTTFVALLGSYLASIGQKVLVVDADFLRPALGPLMGVAAGAPGLADVLSGRATLSDTIRRDQGAPAVLGAGTRSLATPDALRLENLQALFAQLKAQYTYILIDAGPALARTEASAIAAQTDGIIAVTDWFKTSETNVTNMLDVLKESKTPLIGMVLNRVDIKKYKDATVGSDFLLPRIDNAA